MSNLDTVRTAAAAYESAGLNLRTAITEAVEGGVSVAAIAEEIGVARTTIYRWIDSTQTATVNVDDFMDQVAILLASYGLREAAVIVGNRSHPREARARHLANALRGLHTPQPLDPEDAGLITRARALTAEIERLATKGETIPTRLHV